MGIIVERTKISKGNQVVVPSKIRKKFDVGEGDEVLWTLIGDSLILKFVKRKKRSLSSLLGKIDMGVTNAVEDHDEIINNT